MTGENKTLRMIGNCCVQAGIAKYGSSLPVVSPNISTLNIAVEWVAFLLRIW
jgi:hypothetical protein